MTSKADEQLARIVARRFRAASSGANQRERDADAHARALARAGRQKGGTGHRSGGAKGDSGTSAGKPFRVSIGRTQRASAGTWQRVRRAPASASKFRYEHKYSRRSGGGGSPTSAVAKVEYDHDLNNKTDISRVEYATAYIPTGMHPDAHDPVIVAQLAEATAGRQINCRMMGHDTISLPSQLNAEQRHALADRLARQLSDAMESVPVYIAVHEPDGNNENWHAHASYPLRLIETGTDGEMLMGRRIAFEQRPDWRKEHGLDPTNHNDLKALRGTIAAECADALRDAGVEANVCERWRNGHLRLNAGTDTQVSRAGARGDQTFVEENATRETQRHEGPGHRRNGLPTPMQEHNASLEKDMAPRVLISQIMSDTLNKAKSVKVQSWEDLREIAARRGLRIDYTRRQHRDGTLGKVTGWRLSAAGNTVSGQQAGYTLRSTSHDLHEAGMAWAETVPEFSEPPSVHMEKGTLQRATESVYKRTNYRQAREASTQQAEPAKAVVVRLQPVAPARAPSVQPQQPHERPKGRLSNDHRIKEGVKPMDISIVMKDIVEPPPGHPAQAALFHRKDIHPIIGSARAKDRVLTEAEKRFMAARHPDQARIRAMTDKFDRLVKEARVHAGLEPKAHTILGGTRKHDIWTENHAQITAQIARVKEANARWLDKNVFTNQALLADMDAERDSSLMMQHRENSALGEYRRQERIAGVVGPQGAHAKGIMREIEEREPSVIAKYKKEEGARKAAEAQQRLEQERITAASRETDRRGGGGSQGSQHVVPKG